MITEQKNNISDIQEDNGPRKKILVKLPNYIGDVIMCLPALNVLKNTLDEYDIYLLTEDNLSDLLYGQDFDDRIICNEGNPHELFPWTISRNIKKAGKFHVAICLTRQMRFTLAFRLARIPVRSGCNRFPASIWLNKDVPDPERDRFPDFGKQYYLDLIERILQKIFEQESCEVNNVTLKVNESIQNKTDKLLEGFNDRKYYVLVPGSSYSIYGLLKRWPLESFVKLASRMHREKPELVPLFLFGPDEKDLYKQLVTIHEKDLKFKYIKIEPYSSNIGDVMSIINRSEFVVTNDTGPRHIAVALQKKTISIFGPTSIDKVTYPANLEYPIWINVGCNLDDDCKCAKHNCNEKRICITAITPGLVCEKIMEFIYNKSE